MIKVRMRKFVCMVLSLLLVASCLCINSGATEITGQMGTPIVMRASGKFEMDVPGHKLVKAKTSFPLEAGEQVTIKASYDVVSSWASTCCSNGAVAFQDKYVTGKNPNLTLPLKSIPYYGW